MGDWLMDLMMDLEVFERWWFWGSRSWRSWRSWRWGAYELQDGDWKRKYHEIPGIASQWPHSVRKTGRDTSSTAKPAARVVQRKRAGWGFGGATAGWCLRDSKNGKGMFQDLHFLCETEWNVTHPQIRFKHMKVMVDSYIDLWFYGVSSFVAGNCTPANPPNQWKNCLQQSRVCSFSIGWPQIP